MHVLTVFREGAAPTRAELPDGVHVVGSGERCRVRLPAPGVSERHALLMLSGDKASVEDMGSDAGTLVNAVPVAKRTPVTASTPITVGPYTLTLAFVPASAGEPPADGQTVERSNGQTVEPSGPCDRATERPCDPPPAAAPSPADERRRSDRQRALAMTPDDLAQWIPTLNSLATDGAVCIVGHDAALEACGDEDLETLALG